MEIKTLGDFRKITETLDDDYVLDISIMREVPEEEAKNRMYPYPWDMLDATMEFQDVVHGDKEIYLGIYKK